MSHHDKEPDWQRWQAELADIDPAVVAETGPVLVDSAPAQRPPTIDMDTLRQGKRRPVIPAWLRSKSEVEAAVRWAVGYAGHTSAYHATRAPKYAGKLALRAPRGAIRVIGSYARWLFDLEGDGVRAAAVRREDAHEYLQLTRQRDWRVRFRAGLTITILIGLAVLLLIVVACPFWIRALSAAVGLAALGLVGAPADKPLLDTAVVVPRAQKLTSDVVVRALSVLGLGGMNQALAKNPKAVTFVAPITRDGPGWRADVDLPHGVTVGEVMDRRDKLAAGLSRPLGCVWPEGQPDIHPGRLLLWVADQAMADTRPHCWPLAKTGTADVFTPQPFGADPRGRAVAVELMFNNVLIGAIPRQGKTFALRVLALTCALDPTVEMHVFELKGTGDLSALEQVAHSYGSGAEDAVLDTLMDSLRYLAADRQRRAKVISGLPKDVCPGNKVTRELACKKSLGLHPVAVIIDEIQELFTHPDYKDEAEALIVKLIKLAPSQGIFFLLATQRPDKESLPKAISANVSLRYCLRVMGDRENNMVLGSGAYAAGIRATMFTTRDKGIGYLIGAADEAQIVRSDYIDAPHADAIATRARALRDTHGRLSGHATGQAADTQTGKPRYDLLADIVAVVPEAEAKVWNETVVKRLAQLRPDVYGPWLEATKPGEQLTTALKPYRIKTTQVWGTTEQGVGANRRGFTRSDIHTAITDRDQKKSSGDSSAP